MTEQEYNELVKKQLRLMADIQLNGRCSGYEALSELSRTKILDNLKINLLETEIAYLKSRVDRLEKLG